MSMPAKQGLRSKSTYVGEDCLPLAAGSYDLVALSPSGKHCARRVVLVTAGDLTQVWNAKGVNRGPITGLGANYVHECDTSYVQCTAPIVVYY